MGLNHFVIAPYVRSALGGAKAKKHLDRYHRTRYSQWIRIYLHRTGSEVIKHHKGFGFVNGGKSQQNKLWLEDLIITSLGQSVVVTGIWFFKKPGKLQKGPVTIFYLKEDNQFKIAHMHFANY